MADLTLEDYFEEVPDDRKDSVNELHELIVSLFPNATVSMKYKMPTYESESGWTALANQKNYISLYTCGPEHLESFKKKHPKIKTGKGCINFKPTVTLPLDDLKSVVQSAMTRGH